MKGLNTAHLNVATVMEAAEEYLNKRLAGSAQVVVTAVRWRAGTMQQLEVDFEPPALKGKP